MAKKVTDKDTKQTTKATSENIMNSDQMKEHLDNLVDMAKKNDNTLIDTEIVNYFVGKPDIELNTDMMTKIFDYLDEHHVAVLSETEEDDEILDDMILEDAEDADIDIEKIDLSVPDGVSIEDPVRMYLKEIGKVPLLTCVPRHFLVRPCGVEHLKGDVLALYLAAKVREYAVRELPEWEVPSVLLPAAGDFAVVAF